MEGPEVLRREEMAVLGPGPPKCTREIDLSVCGAVGG